VLQRITGDWWTAHILPHARADTGWRRVLHRWNMSLRPHAATPSSRDATATAASEGARDSGRTDARQAAFEHLFRRHSESLFEYLCGMTRDRELASDLVQDTFVRAYAARVDVAAVAYPQAWLFRIATNLALTATKRRGHFDWVSLETVEPQPGPGNSDQWRVPPELLRRSHDLAATVVERDAVWQVLAELPPRWRAALLLQTAGGQSVADIASLLGLSQANVRKVLFRAKERFRSTYRQLEARAAAEGGRA
jgi:RNA polymerase sigma-70 factor, ECF subfamily